ncbi:MAG: GMC family oxidoreductase [Opitutaceae bacterium]
MNEVDVLIIGAGATGAAAAWNLSDCGLRVLCLEQGGRMEAMSFPTSRVDWEALRYGAFSVNPNIRKGKADYPINDADSPISIANFNAVGGSTILYSAHFPRFHPSDFKVRTLDGVADDWPIDYAMLENHFAKNDEMMGVAGLADDPAYPPIDKLLPPVPLGKLGETLGKGYNKLGWHWWPSYSAIATRRVGNRDKCVNLGPCNLGCAQGAKASVDVTYWPIALRNGVELRTYCRVRELVTDGKDRVTGVVYFDADGREQIQTARLVIVACNGVGTPRLLLNSRSESHPNGLANSSDLVGRNLMLHPLGYVEGLFDEQLDSHMGPQGCCIYSHEFYETDAARGFVRGYTMHTLRGPWPVEAAASGIARREIPWGAAHHDAFASRFGHVACLAIITEDLPDPENRVTLDPSLCDSNGIPAPKITYRLGENSKKMLKHGLKQGKAVMTAAGAKKVSAFGPVKHTGWHLMGTTRMGTDPTSSVVDATGRAHDLRNLFIVDSSVFVTSGGVNPVATMQAITLYITTGIKNNFGAMIG